MEVDGGGGRLVRVAMFHPHGSPMRSEASSASRSRGRIRAEEGELLPLIDCPQCKVPVVKLRSKKRDSYGILQVSKQLPDEIDSILCGFRLRLMSGSVSTIFSLCFVSG